jgi:bifunctional UDP-N-acetylglucosamine pyrophosphorylase / glucosamine-1-phosphate N-acetyltransferase
MSLSVVILAAGQGTRMRSQLPKVLHPVADRPMLEHVIQAAQQLSPRKIYVVYGHGGDKVTQTLSHLDVTWVQQAQQLGTGHAVAQALPQVNQDDVVLVLYGDVPLIAVDTLKALVTMTTPNTLCLLTVQLADPTGYGRIVRDAAGAVSHIVEHKDASPEQRAIKESNTGVLACHQSKLAAWVASLDNKNAQGEFYLTDVIGMAVRDGLTIKTVQPATENEVLGVNDRVQLAFVERLYQQARAEALMRSGVTLRDPARIDIRGELAVGRDSMIDVNAVFEGKVTLGERVSIGPNCCIKNAVIGDDTEILANTVMENVVIGKGARIGPFARIRPESELGDEVHIGNFVEVKKSKIAAKSKVNHLSYVGDTVIGSRVNVGAGTITCNYDGANKYLTVIEDDVFIGSDTQLIAPVTVEKGATIGAGSTITQNCPADKLTMSRVRQFTIENWERPKKKPKA